MLSEEGVAYGKSNSYISKDSINVNNCYLHRML